MQCTCGVHAVVLEAHRLAQQRAGPVGLLLEHGAQRPPDEEEDGKVDPVHDVPHVKEVRHWAAMQQFDQLEHDEEAAEAQAWEPKGSDIGDFGSGSL